MKTAPAHAITAALASAMLTLAASLAGCAANPRDGYSFRSTYDTSITTVAVPVFANTTQHTGIETDLTDAIIKKIQRDTPWRVSQSEAADAVLQGRINSVRLVKLSTRTRVGLVQEQGLSVSISFEFVDNRKGRTLVERNGFSTLAAFVPANPTGERISVGYRGAAESLATDIVNELANAW